MFNVTWVSLFAFAMVLQPSPVWDPQYVIPIVGMLLGNCINGISLCLNSMLVSMVDSAREIELLLAFGASPYEASARLLRESIRTGTMPQLNSMAIIGVISIPGSEYLLPMCVCFCGFLSPMLDPVMTGQILGGSTVNDAARYQILIMYLIATCSFGTVLSQLFLCLRICFDSKMTLRADRLKKRRKKRTIGALIDGCCSQARDCFSNSSREHRDLATAAVSNGEATILPKGELSVALGKEQRGAPLLSVRDLGYSFEKPNADGAARRRLFENVNFELSKGQRVLIEGPSGVGKSTLVRISSRICFVWKWSFSKPLPLASNTSRPHIDRRGSSRPRPRDVVSVEQPIGMENASGLPSTKSTRNTWKPCDAFAKDSLFQVLVCQEQTRLTRPEIYH